MEWGQHCQTNTTVDTTRLQKKRATKEHMEAIWRQTRGQQVVGICSFYSNIMAYNRRQLLQQESSRPTKWRQWRRRLKTELDAENLVPYARLGAKKQKLGESLHSVHLLTHLTTRRSSYTPRACEQLKGSEKEPNISIYFFFPPITQWCSIFRCSVYW